MGFCVEGFHVSSGQATSIPVSSHAFPFLAVLWIFWEEIKVLPNKELQGTGLEVLGTPQALNPKLSGQATSFSSVQY